MRERERWRYNTLVFQTKMIDINTLFQTWTELEKQKQKSKGPVSQLVNAKDEVGNVRRRCLSIAIYSVHKHIRTGKRPAWEATVTYRAMV